MKFLKLRQRMTQDVAKGWDPVTDEYAEEYSNFAWSQSAEIEAVVARVERTCGPLNGRTVLDLGAGPGQFTAAFAARGAIVTWRDPSARYQAIARSKVQATGAPNVTYSLGHIDEAGNLSGQTYDLVFNRVCWYYSADDGQFVDLVYGWVKSGGWAYIVTHNSRYYRDKRRSWKNYAAGLLYEYFGVKLTYLHPRRGLIAGLILRKQCPEVVADCSDPSMEFVAFRRS